MSEIDDVSEIQSEQEVKPRFEHPISPFNVVTLMKIEKPRFAFYRRPYRDNPSIPPVDQHNRTTAQGWLLLRAGVDPSVITGWSNEEIQDEYGNRVAPKTPDSLSQIGRLEEERVAKQEKADALTANVLDIPLAYAKFFTKISSVLGPYEQTLDQQRVEDSLTDPEKLLGPSVPQLLTFVQRLEQLTTEDIEKIVEAEKLLFDKASDQFDQVKFAVHLSQLPSPREQRFYLHQPFINSKYKFPFDLFKGAVSQAVTNTYLTRENVDSELAEAIKSEGIQKVKDNISRSIGIVPKYEQDRWLNFQKTTVEISNLVRVVDQALNEIVYIFDLEKKDMPGYINIFPQQDGSPITEEWLRDNPFTMPNPEQEMPPPQTQPTPQNPKSSWQFWKR